MIDDSDDSYQRKKPGGIDKDDFDKYFHFGHLMTLPIRPYSIIFFVLCIQIQHNGIVYYVYNY